MHHIKFTISYDGTNYSGWQIQRNGTTVQELVQNAVRSMTGEENNVVGAGRTDAGVHALGQVASFRTERDIPLEGFRRGLNTALPKDIRISSVGEVAPDFHPIRDARSKHYRYIISEGAEEDPLNLNRCWAIGRPLDIEKMREAAEFLIGRHDFTSFCASDSCDDDHVKEIDSIVINPLLCKEGEGGGRYLPHPDPPLVIRGGGCIVFDITGGGFLKHMVRNIVGTLADVGTGRLTPDEFKKIMDAKDRRRAGVTAPACGLYLVEVEY